MEFVEVSPRDGLQNEAVILSTAAKVELIERSAAAGARRIEVASFVNPRLVPQMADAEDVVAAIADRVDIVRIGLVLNTRGAQRALATAVDELGVVCVASDAFGLNNQGATSEATVEMAADVLALAQAAGRRAQVTFAVSFGCPFEGAVPPARVVDMARRLAAAGFDEVALADTIGIAHPIEVSRLVRYVVAAVSGVRIRAHFHDTRGMGVANALAAADAGAEILDGSTGGVGGCPFAPGAAGNVASEGLAYAFGDALHLDRDRLLETAAWLHAALGRPDRAAVR